MITYLSRTGNVRHIVDKLGLPSEEIHNDLVVNQPYFLFTYTDGLGEVPEKVLLFLRKSQNSKFLKGVIVTGNVNFGSFFCKAGDLISITLHVPIIRKIDLRGSTEDIEAIKEQYKIYIEGE